MPRKRPDPSKHPQLPEWVVVHLDLDDEPVIEITCTRCGGSAIILSPSRWFGSKRNRDYVARSCTYCFKVSRLPEEE